MSSLKNNRIKNDSYLRNGLKTEHYYLKYSVVINFDELSQVLYYILFFSEIE